MHGSMANHPSLFDSPARLPAAPREVGRVHERLEDEHAAVFLARVRDRLAEKYAGTGREITTDEAHELMEQHGIRLPAGASPNVLGGLFSGWARAESTGNLIRSKRCGANGNVLRTWVIR